MASTGRETTRGTLADVVCKPIGRVVSRRLGLLFLESDV